MKKIVLLSVAIFTNMMVANAIGPVSTATAPAKIKIISPLTISKAVDMEFGTVAVSTGSATIQISPADVCNAHVVTGTASLIANPQPTAAKFSITGLANAAFSLSIPTPISVTDNGGNGGAAMSLALTCDQTGTAPNYNSSLSASGAKDIYVGGTLTLGANQTASTYQGTITVNVNYN